MNGRAEDPAGKRVHEPAAARTGEHGSKPPVRTFRDLLVWQKGMTLAESVYRATRSLPPDERFGLTSQMHRAAFSVPANIAEGHARQSRRDDLRFLRTARGSIAELETHIELGERLGLLGGCRELAIMLQSLIRKLEAKGSQP